MSSSIYFAIPLMAVLAIVQTAVLPYFPILGMTPQLPLLVSISWALLRGIDEGVIWAFIAGLFLDLMSVTPIGVTSLSFMFGILAVIWVQQAIPTSRFLLPVILAFSATLVALLVNILLLRTLQLVVDLSALSALFPMTLLHAVLILPVYWTAYWIDRTIRPRKVTV